MNGEQGERETTTNGGTASSTPGETHLREVKCVLNRIFLTESTVNEIPGRD